MRRARIAAAAVAVFAASAFATMLVPSGAVAEQASQPGSPAPGQLDVGANLSCAIVTGGQVRCWGYGAEGELGYPGLTTVGATNTPAAVGPVNLGAGYTATALSSGDYHTCVIRNDGSVVCWGYGENGRLGYGNTTNVGGAQTPGSAGPVNLGPGRTAKAISAGGAHTCAILDDGSVRCWGYGYYGQLGYGNTKNVGDTSAPGPIGSLVDLGAGRTAKAISAGGLHTCVILDNGSVLCWGYGADGQLGYGNTKNVGDTATPGAVGPVDLGAGHTAVAISAGASHTCAILDDGSVRCWGFGAYGQLGYGNANNVGATPGSTASSGGPVNLGPGRTAVAISAGNAHTCAILDNGSALCWGAGGYGRLGYGNTNNAGDTPASIPASLGPVDLGPGRTALAISAGALHTCARLDDGSVRCWGYGANGRLGYCGQGNVGATPATTPGTAGPVKLAPGDGGELCPAVPVSHSAPSISGRAAKGQTLTERHGSWSPSPTGYTYQWQRCDRAGRRCRALGGASAQTYRLRAIDVGSTIRVRETAMNGSSTSLPASSAPTAVVTSTLTSSDAARARGWRRCLAAIPRAAGTLASGRRRCLKIYGRTPGRVTGVRVLARGATKIELSFLASGTDGENPPAARSYIVKQSLQPIASERDFTRAQTLCQGACRFAVTQAATKIELTIHNLRPHTTYYYAIAARDNVTTRLGPRSRTIKAQTR